LLNIVYLYIAQISVLVSSLLVYKLILNYYGFEAFSIYSSIKRILSLLFSINLLGLSTTLTKYISYYFDDKQKIFYILLSSIVIFSIPYILFTFFFIFFSKDVSQILFHTTKFEKFITIFPFIIFSQFIYTLIFSYLRATLNIKYLSLTQIIILVFVPIISLLLSANLYNFFLFSAILSILILLSLSFSIFKSYFIYFRKNNNIIKNIKTTLPFILEYSLQRFPADILLNLLLTLPIIILSHKKNYIVSGLFAFTITILQIISYVISPIGTLLLPKTSRAIREKNMYIILKDIKKVVIFVLFFNIFIIICFVTLGNKIIIHFFSGKISNKNMLINQMSIIYFSIIGYSFFISLRSILDALYNKAIVSLILLISLINFLIFSFFSIKYAFVLSINILGTISFLLVFRDRKIWQIKN